MNKVVKLYLSTYNLAAFAFWVWYLLLFTESGFQVGHEAVEALILAQGIALLEIVHAALKWVKSPVGSTAAQVLSRVLVMVLIAVFAGRAGIAPFFHTGVVLVSAAWGITELIRYSFYFLNLWDTPPRWLLWMRYSFFIVLYPAGVTGEWFIIAACLWVSGTGFNLSKLAAAGLFVAYLYYFPVLYRHMWRQRSKQLKHTTATASGS